MIQAVTAAPGHHHAQRFAGPGLAQPEPFDRCAIAGIAKQVVAADAAHRDDQACTQGGHRRGQGRPVAVDLEGSMTPPQAWTTGGAGQRLGVESPVERIRILRGTSGTQRELRQRGVRSVVRQRTNHGVARPALRTVDEGITVAPRQRVAHLLQAIRARAQIRGDVHAARRAAAAPFDAKQLARFGWGGAHIEHPGGGGRRRQQQQRFTEHPQSCGYSLGVDLHLAAVVAHPAGEFEAMGKSIHEGPEAHALDPPADPPALRGGDLSGGGAHAERWRARCSGVQACGVRCTNRCRAMW